MNSQRPVSPDPADPAQPPTEWHEHLARVLDSLDALVYIADIETYELLFVNRYGQEIFGDILGRPCWKVLQQGQDGPCAFCTNDRIVTPDGRPAGLYQWEFQNTLNGRWYDCRDKAIRWSDGRLVRMEIATDITERKLAQQREEDHLRRLEMLTASVPGMVYQYQRWPDGRCAMPYASQGITDLYGMEPEAVAEDASLLFDAIHPEDRGRVIEGIRQSAEALTRWHDRWRILQPDGRPVWLESEARPQALPDASVLWHGHVRDVTERELTEQALSALAGELAALNGQTFFEAASRRLCELLGLDYVFVGQLHHTSDSVTLLAGWGGGAPMAPLSYSLPGTPCANVGRCGSALFAKDVQRLFPDDRLLVDMNIDSYVGSTLFDSGRRPLGILVGLGRQPIRHERLAAQLLDLFVGRLGAELERTHAERQLRQSASVFEHANEGIMITDAEGVILDINDAFTRITGYRREEAIGETPRILRSGRHGHAFYQAMWRSLATYGHWTAEVWNRRSTGAIFATKQTVSAVYDETGAVCRYVSLYSDITALKEHQQRLEHIAHYDSLTDLPNRALLAERLRQGIADASRDGRLLGVAYLDLDGFKEVNDVHGHGCGDRLLGHLAAQMKHALREGDTLARLGGDEFIAVLTDLPSRDASVPILKRLLTAAATPATIDGCSLQVSASVGVAFYPQAEPVAADQLMRQADQAMYAAKLAGKNRYRVFDAEHDQALRGHFEALGRVRDALARQEFVLHYQPKVDMRSGAVIGAEALIRWQHPERGLLQPPDFLPLVATHELSVDLGAWVLETAATQIERWRALGLQLPVSVNIDGRHFAHPSFMSDLRTCLARHPGVHPGELELEVLETSALEDIERISEVAAACEEIGVSLALDDFGTGYSTLTHLKQLPARMLKIDRSFVRDMLDDPEDLAILEGVIGLASAFRRETIAEGVESVAHGAMLLSLGCNLAQGFGIARPMPADALPDWVRNWQPDPGWSNRPRVNNDDLPVLFAIVEHRAWVQKLRAHAQGQCPAPPPLNPHDCRFGRWLDGGGRQRYAADPSMARIDQLHLEIHESASAMVDRVPQDRGLQEELATIEALRDELTRLLDGLISPSPGTQGSARP